MSLNEEVFYVRLKPLHENSPEVQPKSYRIWNQRTERWMNFSKPGTWVKVLPEDKPMLERKTWQHTPASPSVFDICSYDEAKRIDEQLRLERESKRILVEPTVDTADDMTSIGGDLSTKDLSMKVDKNKLVEEIVLPFDVEDDKEDNTDEMEPVTMFSQEEVTGKAKRTKSKRRGRPRKKS